MNMFLIVLVVLNKLVKEFENVSNLLFIKQITNDVLFCRFIYSFSNEDNKIDKK